MIRNLVFDLGGVLLDIDFKRTFDAFKALGINNAYNLNDHPEVFELFMAFERGEYSPGGFRDNFRALTGFSGSDEEIDGAFNALLLGFVPERIARVEGLGLKYRTYILSNTNAIHCLYYNRMLEDVFGFEGLGNLVSKAYYSHELGVRKPDPRAWTRMIDDSGIVPAETLFIDDREENIVAASKLGFQVVLVDERHTIIEALADL